MRSYRPLIIIPLSILLVILMVVTSFVTPKNEIVGSWVSKENPVHTIEFLQNGIAKSYSENTESKPYHYTLSTACDKHGVSNSLFVKIIDDKANSSKCYELKDIKDQDDDVLLLVDMENNEEYFYTKVY
ncbi:hypothetical protein KORDIASMS9_00920 [Kordia sp. SMS9]|uniref:hypothetical protein n=1 Tax=Kordia sp. SMS9 TaxID=2282170 RepID=UPI000E0D48AC|nr:hypothetical protein [Kordia sp. SMS9]AXG68704.1 hypothetical protein KORDIASMS9_00920 [Kordia sp. SMS9]